MTMPRAARAALPTLLFTLLAAWGGGGSGGGGQGDPNGLPGPEPIATPAGEPGFGIFKVALREPPDRDGDGIPDVEDPFPDAAPQRQTGAPDFVLEAAEAVDGEHRWPDLRHAELDMRFRVRDLDASSGPWFAVFEGPDVIEALPLQRAQDELGLPAASFDSLLNRVYVMTPQWRTNALTIQALRAGAPIYRPQSRAAQGESLTLLGRNLDGAVAELGPRLLDSTAAANGRQLSVTLAADSADGLLRVENAVDSYAAPLQVLSTVRMSRANEPYVAGPLVWASPLGLSDWPSAQAELSILSASRFPRLETFAHAAKLGETVLRRVVIWPDETDKVLGQASILEGVVYAQYERLFGKRPAPDAWAEARAAISALLLEPEAADARAHLAAGMASPEDYSVATLLNLLKPAAARLATTRKRFTTRGREIYDINVTAEANGQIYAQRDFQNYSLDVVESATCNIAIDLLGRPAEVTASDLCLENDSKTFASAAVDIAVRDLDTGDLSYRRVRSHLPAGSRNLAFHKDVVGGNFGGVLQFASVAYLTDDDGAPVCQGGPCRVELLTGGWGLGLPKLPAGTPEAEIAEAMFQRTLIESTLFPVGELLTAGFLSALDVGCVKKRLALELFGQVGSNVGNVITLNDFINKLGGDTSPGNIVAVLSDTYFKALTDLLVDAASPERFLACAADFASADAMQKKAAEQGAQALARGLFALQIVQLIVDQAEILFTPRKFTLHAQPLAEVQRADPATMDLTLPSSNNNLNALTVEGQYIAADTPANEAFYPNLVITDREGNRSRFFAFAENFTAGAEQSSDNPAKTKDGKIIAPLAEFTPALETLQPGPVTLSLEIDGYDEFASSVLPVPGGALKLQRFPFAERVDVGAVFAEEKNAVLGYRLEKVQDQTGRTAQQSLALGVRLQKGQEAPIAAEGVDFEFGAGADVIEEFAAAVNFAAPADTPPGDYTVRYLVGAPNEQTGLEVPGTLRVLSDNGVKVVLQDSGAKADDVMDMALRDAQGEVLAVQGQPVVAAVPVEGVFATAIWYEPEAITPADILIRCFNGGADATCTFALEVSSRDSGLTFSHRGKLPPTGLACFALPSFAPCN